VERERGAVLLNVMILPNPEESAYLLVVERGAVLLNLIIMPNPEESA